MIDVLQSFQDHALIEAFIMDKIKAEKEQEQIQMIDKYAIYFIEEFKHFARIHGFIQPGKRESPAQN